MLGLIRILEVIKYGWQHAKVVACKEDCSKSRVGIFIDILYCFKKYKLWSNNYVKESFYSLSNEDRDIVGNRYLKQNQIMDAWYKEYYSNMAFLSKYGDLSMESSLLKRKKRLKEYIKRYKPGKGFYVEYGVLFTNQHYSDAPLVIGANVHIGRNADLDYTGSLKIGNGVSILEGAKILTHTHDTYFQKEDDELIPYSNRAVKTPLVIKDNAKICARAMIMPGVKEIGENSVVSAGSVVTKKVPDNVIVSGNPAVVIAKIPPMVKINISYKK